MKNLFPLMFLIAIQGRKITEVKEIHHTLAEIGWGKGITFTIIREGKTKEVTVTLPLLED
jgi:S1-C subfamily serine protease